MSVDARRCARCVGWVASRASRSFNLASRSFNLASRNFNLASRNFNLAWRGIACAILVSIAFGLVQRAAADLPGTLKPAAAGEGHLWWVVEQASGSGDAARVQADAPFLLMHHASLGPAPAERLVMRFRAVPEAMAAAGNELVLVMRPEGALKRMVLSLSTSQNPALGHWFTEPRSGPTILAPLAAEVDLLDLALADGVLYALVRQPPEQRLSKELAELVAPDSATDTAPRERGEESRKENREETHEESHEETHEESHEESPEESHEEIREANGEASADPVVSVRRPLALYALETRGGPGARWSTVELPPLDLREPLRLAGGAQLRVLGGVEVRASVDAEGRPARVQSDDSNASTDQRPEVVGVFAAVATLHSQVARTDGTRTWHVERISDGAADTPARRAVGLLSVADRDVLVSRQTNAGSATKTLTLSLLRNGAATAWASFDEPDRPWFLAGFGPDAALLTLDERRRGVVRAIPLGASRPGEPVVLAPPGFAAGNWVHIPLIGILAMGLVLAAVIFGADAYLDRSRVHAARDGSDQVGSRRSGEDLGVQPLGTSPVGAPLGRRAMAASIDLLPGFIAAWFVFGGNPFEIVRFPIFVTDVGTGMPALVGVALGWLNGALGDVVLGRSLGKRVARLRIVTSDGSEAGIGRRALRAMLAAITVAAPPVMLLALLNPRGNGPAEMVSGTAVVTDDSEDLPDETAASDD
jgi:uncharacterized RDD family membrane protein YckC